MTPERGAPVRVEMTKWGHRRHWEFDGWALGQDEHGTWLGFPQGTHQARPGFAFDSEADSVTLIPTKGWWVATFHSPGFWCTTYVDIATPAEWDAHVVRAVDLDLDVIRLADGRTPPSADAHLMLGPRGVYVDDEDEFAEHQVALGYPPDVVRAARRSCTRVRAALEAGTAPFDDHTALRWLARLEDLDGRDGRDGLDG